MIEIKTDFQIPIWYETWVKIEWEKFYTMSQSYKNSIGAKIEGELFEDLVPLYKNSIETKCEIIFAPDLKASDKSKIIILDEGELKNHQQSGLSKSEVEFLMNRFYHSNDS